MGSPTTEAQLTRRGFRHLTSWELRNDVIKPSSTAWDKGSGWIYAFATEGRVRYIGIASTVLRTRLDGYSYQLADRVGSLIRQSLKLGSSVSIYGVERPGVSKESLEKEESCLIRELRPDWNVRP